MPIYEFKCKECGQIFEELLYPFQIRKMEEKRTNCPCPMCCGHKTEKIMSTSNFKIKGYCEENGYS